MSCENCLGDCKIEKNTKKEYQDITSAFFILTNQCPLACRYCFVNQNVKNMSYQTALDATSFLIKNAKENNTTPSIVFFGGEPLVQWDNIIVPLSKYIREEYNKSFDLSITSNCVLMTKDKLDFMREYNIKLLFSMDGDKETQDYNRPFHNNKGSFDILDPKIDMIHEYFPNVTFRATIHKNTCANTFHDMKFAVERNFKNMFFIPNVFDDWSKEQKEMLTNQVRMFGDYFIENARNDKIVHLINLDNIIVDIPNINERKRKGMERLISNHKCGLGTGFWSSISVEGDIIACQEMPTNDKGIFGIGNIYDGENLEKRKRLRSLYDSKLVRGLNNCKDCKLKTVCDGGCIANNFMNNGDLNVVSDMFCFWQQLLLEEAIRICNILGSEKNELFKSTYFSALNSEKVK